MQKLFSSNAHFWGVMPQYEYSTEATAKQELQCVLMQKLSPSPFNYTAEKFQLSNSSIFSQTRINLHLIFLFNIKVVIAITKTLSKRGAGGAQPTFCWMSIPCSKIAEFSLLVFLPLFSNCWRLKKNCKFSCKRSVQQQGNVSDTIQGFLRNQDYAVDVYIKPIQ